MNAGFLFVRENYDFDCFIFHDVDLLLETEEGLYKCSNKFPRHLSSSIGTVYQTKNGKLYGPDRKYTVLTENKRSSSESIRFRLKVDGLL